MTDLECLPYGIDNRVGKGVCLLIRLGPYRVLLDCGLDDLSSLHTESQWSDPPADLVLCSHAHADHARGLLALRQAFPRLPIYASEVTTQLLPLNWPEVNVDRTATLTQALPWRSPIEFRDGLTAQLWPAGHLPGAAAFLLSYTPPKQVQADTARTYTVFYTGDFFLSNSRLAEGLPLEELRGLRPDVLIVEGTYGTARHLHRRQQENQLVDRISRALAEGNSVLLPTRALGLGQELVMLLRSHHQFTGRNLDIWVDGRVALGCDAYLDLLPHLPASVQNFARHQPLFWDERVRPRIRRLQSDLRSEVGRSPCIVVTDYTQDLSEYCSNRSSWVLLMHQQATTSVDIALTVLLDNSPNTDPDSMQVAIETDRLWIESYFLSEHCDGLGTTQLIHNLRPQHVIFFHGSPAYLADLASLEELQNRYQLHTPAVGTLVELPIGETFIQPAAPETRYEGEISEAETHIRITLPPELTGDPRWGHFADTGLIEARWQGEELVLRGLSQREVLHQGSDRLPLSSENCGHCQYYRGQRCWNQGSPLFGFKVTPDGYCPAFKPLPEESPSYENC